MADGLVISVNSEVLADAASTNSICGIHPILDIWFKLPSSFNINPLIHYWANIHHQSVCCTRFDKHPKGESSSSTSHGLLYISTSLIFYHVSFHPLHSKISQSQFEVRCRPQTKKSSSSSAQQETKVAPLQTPSSRCPTGTSGA